MVNGPILRFVTRERCHICEESAARVRAAARRLGVHVLEVDVDGDEHLQAAFGGRVPVVLNARDRVLAEGRIGTGAAWRAALRARVGGRGRFMPAS